MEILNQMYAFNDKKGRPICLIPEATAIIQSEFYQEKNKRLFYVAKCYRYERPQMGRYREFTQFGVELLNSDNSDKDEVIFILKECLDMCEVSYTIDACVKRGLDYYIEDGFEARCEQLGAQKQIAGGGRYKNGIGFAIGIDRILITKIQLSYEV